MTRHAWGRMSAFSLLILGSVLVMSSGTGYAQATWVDEIANSLSFYKLSYPSSNWEPYSLKLETIKDAVNGGDQRRVKTEMGTWFKMLRAREYGISVPSATAMGGESGF